MKNGKKVIFVLANTGLLSLMSFAAMAGPSAPASLEKMIQANAEQKLAAEAKKYTQIVSLAGTRQDELTARRDEVASTYKEWFDLKSAVVKHYPTSEDYKAIEAASKAYSHAYRAFIDLQKTILAKNKVPLDKVAKKIIALE